MPRTSSLDASNPEFIRQMGMPARYATPVQSPLKATVTANGSNEFPFKLVD